MIMSPIGNSQTGRTGSVHFSASLRQEDKPFLLEILRKAKSPQTPPNQLSRKDFIRYNLENGDVVLTPAIPAMGSGMKYVYGQDGSVTKETQLIYPGAPEEKTPLLPPGSIDPALLR